MAFYNVQGAGISSPAPAYHLTFLLDILAWKLLTVSAVLQLHQLPAGAPDITFSLTTPFSSTSFALSLLLVFRTNTSYSRWNEARTLWGGITNRSRDIVRQVGPQYQFLPMSLTCCPFTVSLHSNNTAMLMMRLIAYWPFAVKPI